MYINFKEKSKLYTRTIKRQLSLLYIVLNQLLKGEEKGRNVKIPINYCHWGLKGVNLYFCFNNLKFSFPDTMSQYTFNMYVGQ